MTNKALNFCILFIIIQVNTDGLISFGQPVPQNNSYPFPLSGDTGLQFIAPFFADVDTRGTGVVWCRETRNTTVLNRAGEEIRKTFTNHFSFQPEFVIIATWDSVGYFDSHTDLVGRNTHSFLTSILRSCFLMRIMMMPYS